MTLYEAAVRSAFANGDPIHVPEDGEIVEANLYDNRAEFLIVRPSDKDPEFCVGLNADGDQCGRARPEGEEPPWRCNDHE